MAPIWQDYYITLSAGSGGTPFRIKCDDTVIFTGTAFPRPGETVPVVKINNICANYLTKTFPLDGDDVWSKTFIVQENVVSGWNEVDRVEFCRDWSYDRSYDEAKTPPQAPIVDYLHPLQYLPVYVVDGVATVAFLSEIGDYSVDFNNDFFKSGGWESITRSSPNNDYFFVPLLDYPSALQVRANDEIYKIVTLCDGYVLYYINAYGGWDTLPVTGKAVRTDNYTRHTRDIVYNNSTTQARGTEEYANEIAVGWQLNIANLTAGQASRMHHLIGSTFVYLHDIERDEIHPVTIDESSLEHKVDSHKLHTFTFRVKLAQERLRR